MPSFCAVFNCSNRADREKGNSNYCFPSVVKNNGKEVLKFSKVRREERLARKSKNKNQSYSFCLPFIGFLTQSSNLGRKCRSPQLTLQIFMTPLILNTNFMKWELRCQTGILLAGNLQSWPLHNVQLTVWWGVLNFNITIFKVFKQS